MVGERPRGNTEPYSRKSILRSSKHAKRKQFTTIHTRTICGSFAKHDPQSRSAAAVLSQRSDNCDAVSPELLSQKSSTCPADIPVLSENWLSRPQSGDPKENRNPLPFSTLPKSSKRNRKTGGAALETLQPLPHLGPFSCSSTHTHSLTP